jgi:hypothetical protein
LTEIKSNDGFRHFGVIAGRAEGANFDVQWHIRESTTTIASMDSGQPPRGFRK